MPIVLRRSTALSVVSAALLLSACGPTSSTSSLPAASGAAGPGSAPASTTRNASVLTDARTQQFTGSITIPPETVPVACPNSDAIEIGGPSQDPDNTITLSGTAQSTGNGGAHLHATINTDNLQGRGWFELFTPTANTFTWTGDFDGNTYEFTGGGTLDADIQAGGQDNEFDVRGQLTVVGPKPVPPAPPAPGKPGDGGDTGRFSAHVRYDAVHGHIFTGNIRIKFYCAGTTPPSGDND